MEVRRIRPHLWTSWIVWMAFFGARGISKKWPVNAWRASAGAHPGIILLTSGQAKHWMQKGIFHLRRSKALHQIDFLVLDDIPLIVLATSEKQTAWGSTGHTRGCAAAGGSGVMLRHLPTHCLWAISEAPIDVARSADAGTRSYTQSIFLQWCLLTASFHNNLASTKSTCHRSLQWLLQLPSKTWKPTKMVRSLERSRGHGSACTIM